MLEFGAEIVVFHVACRESIGVGEQKAQGDILANFKTDSDKPGKMIYGLLL